ncbi:S41 family peptidase [Sphingobacterium spiritivorum]|uniref:S41 family peptidase n=1 Tax=Sphingobacterium spiritivorum TaxID=258 RepID=UPI0019185605|nr:S41 family peptidase [Sphingobacterium spiritivorum]QQT27564.1 PD40 domain-containing protein [Sphingobacterium spiritivorum]
MNKKLRFYFSSIILTVFSATAAQGQQQETLLLRNPSISQNHISFVYGGDIWIAGRDGSNPKRLTVNPDVERNPMFSPDGKQIAFTGNYDGNVDVYTISVAGGEPKRITYHPAADVMRGWINNEELYFTSTQEFQYSLGSRLYKININKGKDEALPMPTAFEGSPSPDGNYWAYLKNSDPTEREVVAFKRYRGGGMPSIWIFNNKTNDIEIVPGEKSNNVKPIWLGDKIYFLSDRDKIVNIFSYDTKTKKTEKITNSKEYDIRTLNGFGDDLIYEAEGKIYTFNIKSKKTSHIPVQIFADNTYKRPHYTNISEGIRNWNVSPTGQRAIFEARGEIFTVPKEKGDARNISSSPGSHERFPNWSPNGKWISYLSDARGKYELVLRDQMAKNDPIYISLGDYYFYFDPIWSPDSKKLFFNDAHLNLYYVDIDTKKVTKVDDDVLGSHTNRTGNYFEPSWSPDSKWISYIKTLPNTVSAVFMYNLDTKQSQQITDGMSETHQPTFSRDGKYLFFTASTNTGLTNSGLHMSAYERSPNYTIYAFILAKDTPSPFKLESDEEAVGKDKEKEEEKKKEEKEEKKEEPKVKNIKVEFDQISNRIVALPLPAGYYKLDGRVEDMLLYQRGRTIGAYDLKKLEDKVFVEGAGGFEVSADGKKLMYSLGGSYFIVNSNQKPIPDNGKLKIDNVKQLVDPAAEWKQVFNEVWAMEKEYFYVENMHGADWNAVKRKYEKFLPYVNHRSDLSYLLNEMMGEMVVGHSYIYPGDQPRTPSVNVGMLGADYKIVDNRYQISKIYTRMEWNPELQAPLAEPGIEVSEGMFIVSVNGVELTADMNIYSLFNQTAGKQTVIMVNSKPSLVGAKEVVVKPIPFSDEINLRQTEWVERNRKRTDELSKGQIAYVYMPNTGSEGYTSFNRYYFSQMDKKALLLDERNNGGGSVADYVIDLLSRDLIAGWGIRDGKSFTTPGNGIYGPKAMIINENAGSGGDMMPYMFRHKGLGKLVGRTTMGILVGISGYPILLDGGRVTSPNFGIFDLKGNYIIENEGVAPDVFVEQTPKEVLQGRDPQLEKTIQILLEEMKTYPYQQMRKPADPVRVN